MNLKSVRLEIDEQCKSLHISNDKFSEVRKDQWRSILDNIEERFLIKTYYTQKGLHWGWNRLKEPTYLVGFVNPTYKYFEYFNQEVHLVNSGRF
ncbi:DUF6756 family protein [Paenibacillus sp. RC67]|uniref:DUF6756 family protein n=1 Tax=Paenibacillus sp. RC67 TaxID=3039392 RepID=UPI0024ADD851|nr:DUF6756 family protein [Paenibacillus sp. RC67]